MSGGELELELKQREAGFVARFAITDVESQIRKILDTLSVTYLGFWVYLGYPPHSPQKIKNQANNKLTMATFATPLV